MLIFMPITFITAFTASVNAMERRAPARIAITNHVLPLVAVPHPYPVAPSSRYLHKRHPISAVLSVIGTPQQDDNNSTSSGDVTAGIQQDLITLGGRVYMSNITLATREYTVVVDTGSSDTWLAASTLQCVSRAAQTRLPQKRCGFGTLFNAKDSPSFTEIPMHSFKVRYADGEFLTGMMGTEELGIGGVNEDQLKVRQTIGVAERGWWMGDGVSSGLMGLAFPTLASNVQDMNYTSVVWTLFEDGAVPRIFSLALSRPTAASPTAGGLLAIGGIPDIAHDSNFASVPIHPIFSNTYTFYSIPVDGFDITPPAFTPNSPSAPNSNAVNYTSAPLDMIIDSGSSLLRFPDIIADYIASLFVPHAVYSFTSGTYLVPCSASAPRVGVIIAGKSFYIHEEDLMNKGPGAVREGRPGMCTLAVMRPRDGDAVLGDSWLKGVLAVFDVGGNEMRFSGRENY